MYEIRKEDLWHDLSHWMAEAFHLNTAHIMPGETLFTWCTQRQSGHYEPWTAQNMHRGDMHTAEVGGVFRSEPFSRLGFVSYVMDGTDEKFSGPQSNYNDLICITSHNRVEYTYIENLTLRFVFPIMLLKFRRFLFVHLTDIFSKNADEQLLSVSVISFKEVSVE